MTQTVRTRPRGGDHPPTISTTQELPPPPPGRWARLWARLRTSPVTPRLLIVLPVVALLAIGVVSGLRSDGSGVFASQPGEPPGVDSAIVQWEADTQPVFAAMAAARTEVEDAIAAGNGDEVSARCREAWQQLPVWADALVPAPNPTIDAAVRKELAELNELFGGCSLTG